MGDVLDAFLIWFVQFAGVSLLVVLLGHGLARRLRARRQRSG